jgi:hypothetical protein
MMALGIAFPHSAICGTHLNGSDLVYAAQALEVRIGRLSSSSICGRSYIFD